MKHNIQRLHADPTRPNPGGKGSASADLKPKDRTQWIRGALTYCGWAAGVLAVILTINLIAGEIAKLRNEPSLNRAELAQQAMSFGYRCALAHQTLDQCRSAVHSGMMTR